MLTLDKIKKRAETDKVSTSLVFKEHVHLIILEYLFKKGLFSQMVFQGGTALRLVYHGVRYSEDLDFVLQNKGLPCFENMYAELQPLTSQIKKLIPFVTTAHLKVQKETPSFRRYSLALEADFLNAKDKTNIEIANIPSHKYQTIIIRHPDVSLSPAINVEIPEEILSDKLLAFCARDYIKGRDLWDIYFIMHTLNVSINKEIIDMVGNKISDYGLTKNEVLTRLNKRIEMLTSDGVRLLHEEMDRFLPSSYRETFKDRYPDICNDELNVFITLLKELKT
ncbi:MAG: nucleotidyl transferase AbiEii/AbiGii toxin family protein [Candidatus Omnitrophota bacterium]